MTPAFIHAPVLLPETIEALQPRSGRRYVDATVGGGGHAEKVLDLSSPKGLLLGIDADPQALQAARVRLARFGDRFTTVHAHFDALDQVARDSGFDQSHGVLFDLGVSSPQLDRAERGFSFSQDAPLDMRFDPTGGSTAADLVNSLSQTDLSNILFTYGEERYARRIAERLVRRRADEPIRTTAQLAAIVAQAKPKGSREHIHPATRVFQALRIAVNSELDRLEAALPQVLQVLRIGGRLVVISFHSLEDRIVKQFLRREARGCICPPELPACICGRIPTLRILTPRPVTASASEVAANPRARSAKLRAAEIIAHQSEDPHRLSTHV